MTTNDLVVAVEKVPRCNACGGEVPEGAERHEPEDCTRGGGAVVEVFPLSCAITGCGIQRSGQQLPTRTHHADHLHWHIGQWEREAARGAPAPAPPPPEPSRAVRRVFDQWEPEAEIRAGGISHVVVPHHGGGAACVAILAHCSTGLIDVAIKCHAGVVPLAVYLAPKTDAAAVVKVAPQSGDQDLLIENAGDRTIFVRVGVRWELWQ